jgi:hypothetical protein
MPGINLGIVFWGKPMCLYLVDLFVVLVFFAAIGKTIAVEIASDHIVLPPEQREFAFPATHFVLALATADNWKTSHCSAELYWIRSSDRELVWRLLS